jgi:DNA-binding transcriptional LysR family regulator
VGVTVTKWTTIWSERFRRTRLEVVPLAETDAIPALNDGRVAMAFLRLPVADAGLHLIPLYREVAVVVVPKDHPASVFEELTLADLADENLLEVDPRLDADLTADLIAGGAGLAIMPQSIARTLSRSDLVYRPVADAPSTQIALGWRVDRTSDLTEDFVGVVRGRTVNSSRSPSRDDQSTSKSRAKRSRR